MLLQKLQCRDNLLSVSIVGVEFKRFILQIQGIYT